MIFYGAGTKRIFYHSAGLATGLTVTAYVWNTSLVKSDAQSLTEVSDGLYYFDYNYSAVGNWPIVIMEGGIGTVGTTIRIFSPTVGGGSGATATVYTVLDGDEDPIDGASVWVTTDEAGTIIIASGTTNSFGKVTFYLDSGTYYVWTQKAGYDFTNPDTEVVA